MKTYIIAISIIGLLSIVAIVLIIIGSGRNDTPPSNTVPSYEISLSQVLKHSTPTDCWVGLGGSVYRLDNYFVKHPDDSLASQLCGKIDPDIKLPNNLKKEALLSYRLGILAP